MKPKPIIRFSFGDYKAITAHLAGAGDDESFIYALFSKTVTDQTVIYICNRLLIPDGKQLENQSCVSIQPSREYQAIAYGLAYELGLSIIDIHTHPFSCQARFSSIDDYHGTQNAEYIGRHFADCSTMGMIVFGSGFENFQARLWNRVGKRFDPIDRIEILGSPILILNDRDKKKPEAHKDPYARHRIIPGWKQGLLEDLNVFVCGLGGNGALLFDSLLALGVGKANGWIKACDPDVLEASNLPRIPYAYLNEIGQSKAKLAQLHADCKAPGSNVCCYSEGIDSKKMQQYAKEANILLGAVDNDGGRMLLNSLAARYLIPYIDLGTEIIPEVDAYQAIGQIQTFIPGKTGCLMCSGVIDPSQAALDTMHPDTKAEYAKAGYVRGTQETPTPSILHLNGVISHLAVSQMLRMIFGENIEGKEYLHYDRQNVRLLTAAISQDNDCPVCGIHGYLGNGDEDVNVLDTLCNLKDGESFANCVADSQDSALSRSNPMKNSNVKKTSGIQNE